MTDKISKPCVYRYLFSRLPYHRTDEVIAEIASVVASPISEAMNLEVQEGFAEPYPDVVPLTYRGNEATQTFLLQFYFNDILTTVLTLNQVDNTQTPLEYFRESYATRFPESPQHEHFGEMTLLFAQGQTRDSTIQKIANGVYGGDKRYDSRRCTFKWGRLDFLLAINQYILLIPKSDDLVYGDRFLAFDFAMLEAIRQKLRFEQAQSEILRARNIELEASLKKLLSLVTNKLDAKEEHLPLIEETLDQMDDEQAELYDNICKLKAILHTLKINLENFETFLSLLPISRDSLYTDLPRDFRFGYQTIETKLLYTELLLPGITKRQETIQLKIELVRQKTAEKNIRVEKRQSVLIAVLGVMIGTGEVIQSVQSFDWYKKLAAMLVSGLITCLLMLLLNRNGTRT